MLTSIAMAWVLTTWNNAGQVSYGPPQSTISSCLEAKNSFDSYQFRTACIEFKDIVIDPPKQVIKQESIKVDTTNQKTNSK